MNIFQLKDKDVNKNISMQNISKWDSLNHIGLISEIEETFKIQFQDDEIVDMIVTLKDNYWGGERSIQVQVEDIIRN